MNEPELVRILIVGSLQNKDNANYSYIAKCKEAVKKYHSKRGEKVLRFDCFSDDPQKRKHQDVVPFNYHEIFDVVDEVVFMDDWEENAKCRRSHDSARHRGVKCVYLESGGA